LATALQLFLFNDPHDGAWLQSTATYDAPIVNTNDCFNDPMSMLLELEDNTGLTTIPECGNNATSEANNAT
jgi:hypothetical protein